MAVKIVPTEDGALTAASGAELVWRKMYPSMDAATSEAVELQIMTASEKSLAVMSQPMPTYALGFSSKLKLILANSSGEASCWIPESPTLCRRFRLSAHC